MMQSKKIRRRKRCLFCKGLFQPDPRTKGKQRYCSKELCQGKRQRKNERDWRKRNPECVDSQYEQTRQWFKSHPQYSAQRRANNPKILDKNRHQTRVRMKKIRTKQLFDKSKVILTQIVGGKSDKCYLARGGSWLLVRLTKASPLSRLKCLRHNVIQRFSVANQLPRGKLYDMFQFFRSGGFNG